MTTTMTIEAMLASLSPKLKAQFERSLAKASTKATTTVSGECECGCGGHPRGKRSRFLPGHDAKLVSKLVAQAQAPTPVEPEPNADADPDHGDAADETPAPTEQANG